MKNSFVYVAFGSIALAVTSMAANAQELIVVKAKLDQVMSPKDAGDFVLDCASSAPCRSLADKGATMLGVPSGAVSTALAVIPKSERKGEEGFFKIALPSGYQYCRSEIRTISVTPAEGDRASVFNAASDLDGIGIYTWTPRQGLAGGRSWVEADITIVGVVASEADRHRQAGGICRPIGKPLIDCRGARGVNKGKPACGVSRD